MKRVLLIALSIAMVVVSAGCGIDGTNNQRESGQQVQGQPDETIDDGVVQSEPRGPADAEYAEHSLQGDHVMISRSSEFGQVNGRMYGVLDDGDDIAVFVKAIRTANKMQGILNVTHPNYDAVIEQNGKRQSIHLWLNRAGSMGMFTFVSDTGIGYSLSEQSTKELIELIWGIYYDTDAAIANGDVVDLIDGVHNADNWLDFVRTVKNGQPGEAQVVQYTIEGGPIFHNLIFEGSSIRYRYDNSHDAFGQAMDLTDFCESITSEAADGGNIYKLAGCSGESSGWFELFLPAQ